MSGRERDYAAVAARLRGRLGERAGFEERLRAVVEELWTALSRRGVSWCGFYLPSEDAAELVLGPRRDAPACSPIGLHGVCGRAFRERRPLVVREVAGLGEAYVACDPRDRSEVAVPVLDRSGECRAVLDLDSREPGAFGDRDAAGLKEVLAAAGL